MYWSKIGALIITIGSWGTFYWKYKKTLQNSVGHYLGPWIRQLCGILTCPSPRKTCDEKGWYSRSPPTHHARNLRIVSRNLCQCRRPEMSGSYTGANTQTCKNVARINYDSA